MVRVREPATDELMPRFALVFSNAKRIMEALKFSVWQLLVEAMASTSVAALIVVVAAVIGLIVYPLVHH